MKKVQHLSCQLVRPRIQLVFRQIGDGVASHQEPVIFDSPAGCHGAAGCNKGCGHDGRGRDTGALQFQSVEHTARTARPSVAHAGQRKIDLLLKQCNRFLADGMAG